MHRAGACPRPEAIANLIAELQPVAPPQVLQIVDHRLRSLEQQTQSARLLAVGIVGALWIASGAISSLMQALNRCYGVVETRPFWKTRGLAIVMTVVAGFMGLIGAAVTFVVPILASWLRQPMGAVLSVLRFPVAGAIMMTFWSLLYRFLPNVKPRFQLISPGSAVGVLIWLLASWGFTEYVRHFASYERSYGAEINKLLTPEEKIQREARTTPPVPSPA